MTTATIDHFFVSDTLRQSVKAYYSVRDGDGLLADIRKPTRANYKRVVKQLKREQQIVKADRLSTRYQSSNQTETTQSWWYNVDSNMLIYSCHKLHVHLASLFNIMLARGFSPHQMLVSTLVHIPKNNIKSLSNSDNYRVIALESVVLEVLDNIILYKCESILRSDDLQFKKTILLSVPLL
jgi:hypothetical protein